MEMNVECVHFCRSDGSGGIGYYVNGIPRRSPHLPWNTGELMRKYIKQKKKRTSLGLSPERCAKFHEIDEPYREKWWNGCGVRAISKDRTRWM